MLGACVRRARLQAADGAPMPTKHTSELLSARAATMVIISLGAHVEGAAIWADMGEPSAFVLLFVSLGACPSSRKRSKIEEWFSLCPRSGRRSLMLRCTTGAIRARCEPAIAGQLESHSTTDSATALSGQAPRSVSRIVGMCVSAGRRIDNAGG